MHVIETVTGTGEQRMIDPVMADGIVSGAEKSGFKVVRTWESVGYSVAIFRPGQWRAMLHYFAPLDDAPFEPLPAHTRYLTYPGMMAGTRVTRTERGREYSRVKIEEGRYAGESWEVANVRLSRRP